MSGLLDQAGLTAGSGLSNGAGLYKWGSFNPFDPTDLDPYLLFDTVAGSMIGTLENPTLDLDPSNQETLDVITATRAGTATYTDPDGLIATASADTVRVDYTQGAELNPTKFQNITNTDFSSGWYAQSGVSAQVADDYQGNAVRRLTYDGVTTGGIYQTVFNTIGGVSYTGSFYIRRISGSTPLYMRTGFSASGNQTAISVTTEWQRFSVTMLGASGGGNVYFGIIQFGAGDDVYEMTQPQLEEGTTASSFVPNTTGSPKFITGATYGPRVPMILVEPSSENLITRSEDFSFSGWTKNGANVANGISSPDGNNTAFKLTEDASASGHYLQETITVSSSTIYTASIFVKYESREWIRFTDAESTNRVHFNTRTGQFGTVVGTVIDYSSTQFDDGWHRITITSTSVNTAYSMRIVLAESDNDIVYTGDGTSGIYVWGAQLEAGSVSTSVIPTSGGDAAARTRAADDLDIRGSAFTNFFNSGGDGTFYTEFITRAITEAPVYVLSGHSSSHRYMYSNVNFSILKSFDGYSDDYTGNIQTTLNRAAISYDSNTKTRSLNGSTVTSIGTGGLRNSTRLSIGQDWSSSNQLNGHFKRVLFWPYSSENL